MPDKHVCPIDGCARSYGSFTSLQTHLILHHDQSAEDYAVKPKKRKSRAETVVEKAHRKEKKTKKKLRTERSATAGPAARPTPKVARFEKPTKGPRKERAASVIDMRSPSPTPSPPSQPLERFSTAPLSPFASPLSKLHAHEGAIPEKAPSTPSRVAMSPDSDDETTTPTPSSANGKATTVPRPTPATPSGPAASPKRPTWATRPSTPPPGAREPRLTGSAAQPVPLDGALKPAEAPAAITATGPAVNDLKKTSTGAEEAPTSTQPVAQQHTPRRTLASPPETPASPTIEQYICRNLPAALGGNAFAAFTGSRLLQDSAVIIPQSAEPASGPAEKSASNETDGSHTGPANNAAKPVLGIDISKSASKVSALLRAIADLVDGTARNLNAGPQPTSG